MVTATSCPPEIFIQHYDLNYLLKLVIDKKDKLAHILFLPNSEKIEYFAPGIFAFSLSTTPSLIALLNEPLMAFLNWDRIDLPNYFPLVLSKLLIYYMLMGQ